MAGIVEVHIHAPARHIESRAFEEGDPALKAYLQHWEEETRRRLGEGIVVTVNREKSLEVRMRVKKNRYEDRSSRYATLMADEDENLDDED